MTYKYGIDFGTTNTSVAIATPRKDQTYKTTLMKIDPGNEWGPSTLIRSVFYVDDSGHIYVGSEAEKIYSTEKKQNRFVPRLKMRLARGEDPQIRGNGFSLDSVDLMAELFRTLKRAADKYAITMGIRLRGAVMGIPLAFNEDCKRKYLEALIKAGFYEDMKTAMAETEFVAEPAAVAVHYGEKLTDNKRVMIFDYGGGTLDTAVFDLRQQIGKADKLHPLDVLGQYVGYDIGGEWINREFFCNFLVPEYGLRELQSFLGISRDRAGTAEDLWREMQDEPNSRQFLLQIEKCKIALSADDATRFIPPVPQTSARPLKSISVDRTDFRDATESIWSSVDQVINVCLKQCKAQTPPVGPNQISEVLLAGGSSLLPFVKDVLAKYFPDRSKLGRNVEGTAMPENEVLTSIVRGLAIVGCTEDSGLNEVLDCAYGVWDISQNRFSEIIPCGTRLRDVETDEFDDRAGKSKKYYAVDPTASEMTIRIVQHTEGVNNEAYKTLKEITINIGGAYGTDFEFFLSVDKKLKMLILKVYSDKKGTFYHIPKESSQISIRI